MSEVNTVISLEGIYKSYGRKQVLRDVNLEIYKGDIFGLIGRNGSGKTTIFKCLLGLSAFQKGVVRVNGESKKLSKERAKIGFFIGLNFFPRMSARQNLKYYADLKGIKHPKEEIERVLKIVDMDTAKGPYVKFSYGMKQRLGVANAILGNPEILILDEPTNGLDPQGIADIRHLIQKLNEEYGMTIIVSSHILGELQNTATRFGILNDGVVAKIVTQEELNRAGDVVRIKVNDKERAKEILTEAGITVYADKAETVSLEDFYFNLVGGNEDEELPES